MYTDAISNAVGTQRYANVSYRILLVLASYDSQNNDY